MKRPAQALALCLLVALAGCTTEDPTATTSIPTTPTTPTVDTLTGTVAVKGQDIKPFDITLSGGSLTVLLTATSQPVTLTVGIGQWDGTTCSLFPNGTRNMSTTTTPQSFNQVPLGKYCMNVNDSAGTLTSAVSYTLTVSHY